MIKSHGVNILDFCEAESNELVTKGNHTKVSFNNSEALLLCLNYMKRNGPPDRQTLKTIVYVSGRELVAEARRQHVIADDGSIVYERKYGMYKLDLYQTDGTKSEDFFADLEPLTVDQDERLKDGRRSSVAVPNELYADFPRLKRIYRLKSDGDLVVHLIIVAATLLRLKKEHGLVTGAEAEIPGPVLHTRRQRAGKRGAGRNKKTLAK